MKTNDYLVEMTFHPFGSPLSPHEAVNFIERMVLPTFEACRKLVAAGRIVAGGTALAAGGFVFIARAESHSELETMMTGLPLWIRSQVRVLPLGTFEEREAMVRERLKATQGANP